MCRVRGPIWRDDFSGRIKGDPHPGTAGRSCALSRKMVLRQLIELEMTLVQVTEEVDADLGGLARPRQPKTNRHFRMAEEQLSTRDGQTEIDGEQDLGDLGSRSAEAIEGRCVIEEVFGA